MNAKVDIRTCETLLCESLSSKIYTKGVSLIDDTDIISQVLLGNRSAYAELVRKYQARIRKYCSYTLSDSVLAEDAAQDIFFKAFQSLSKFRGDAAFSTWLQRIAVNHCNDLLRKRKSQRQESWESLLEAHGDKFNLLFASNRREANVVELRDLAKKIINQLTEEYRQILILKEVLGHSYQEISEILDISNDAVKSRLRRARGKLSEYCEQLLKGEDADDNM